MSRLLRLAPALVLGLTASAASGQVQPPMSPEAYGEMRIPPSEENLTSKQVRQAMGKFADCIVRRHATAAHKIIMDVAGKTADRDLDRILDESCLPDAVDGYGDMITLQTHTLPVTFALAESLTRKKLSGLDPATLSKAPLISKPVAPPAQVLPMLLASIPAKQQDQARRTFEEYRGFATLNGFTECAVRANPHGAHRLLKAPIGSTEEAQAMQAFIAALGGCLGPGRKFQSDKTTLRGIVALNYYRLAHASEIPLIIRRAQ